MDFAKRLWCLPVPLLLVCLRLEPLLVGSSFWWLQLLVWCWRKDLGIQISFLWPSASSFLWLAMSQAFSWHFLPTNLGRGTVKLSINFYKEDKLNTLPLTGFAAYVWKHKEFWLTRWVVLSTWGTFRVVTKYLVRLCQGYLISFLLQVWGADTLGISFYILQMSKPFRELK